MISQAFVAVNLNCYAILKFAVKTLFTMIFALPRIWRNDW